MARLRTNSHQAYRSSCTSIVSWTCRPAARLRACYTRVNKLLDTATSWVILCSSPRRLRHLLREVVRASRGMAVRAAATLSRRVGRRRSRCAIVSRSHPSTIFWVNHAPYPCPSFLRDMGSLLLVSASLLGRNNWSIWWKRCLFNLEPLNGYSLDD